MVKKSAELFSNCLPCRAETHKCASKLHFALSCCIILLSSCDANKSKVAQTLDINEKPGTLRTTSSSTELLESTEVSTASLLKVPISERNLRQAEGAIDPSLDGWDSELFAEKANDMLSKLLETAFADAQSKELNSPDWLEGAEVGELRPRRPKKSYEDQNITVWRWNSQSPSSSENSLNRSAFYERLLDLLRPYATADSYSHKQKIYRVEKGLEEIVTLVRVEINSSDSKSRRQLRGVWRIRWQATAWQPNSILQIQCRDFEEVINREGSAFFSDQTKRVIADTKVARQLRHGMNYWHQRIEKYHGISLGSRTGIAVGDFNGDLLDDLYICQPSGLPNRLFLQQPNGSAKEVSNLAGVDWLDATSSALVIDLDNDGDQDLVVGAERGCLVMENLGNEVGGVPTFKLRRELKPRDLDLKSLTAADYDEDGLLDLYVTVDLSTQQDYRSSLPSFDTVNANDGGRNSLFRNLGDFHFEDITEQVGLDENNHRHTQAAAWEDFDRDGDVDLYVANDYGHNNLYLNENSKFRDIAVPAGVVDIGPGMSAAWGDFNRDQYPDLYVANMWSSAGGRITTQERFLPEKEQDAKQLYRRFAKGNTLFSNQTDGTFSDIGDEAKVELARWAWSSVFIDINNDGWEDLLVANGFHTAEDTKDL